MKIYFAGSIAGGRDDAELYGRIIALLATHGTVFTEHIGDSAMTFQGEGLLPNVVYERDAKWVRECDVLVAEVTIPSLGVGYEIGLAEATGKRVLCLFRPDSGRRLSPMVNGNARNTIAHYATMQDVAGTFATFFISR